MPITRCSTIHADDGKIRTATSVRPSEPKEVVGCEARYEISVAP